MNEAERGEHEPWPLRALLLLALGALAGLALHLLTDDIDGWTEDPLRLGAAALVAVGGIVFAFSLERVRWTWSIAFALAAGLVVGSIAYGNGNPDSWGSGEGWRFAASLLAVAIAVPLFQALRDSGRRHADPRAVHEHVWTNVILWFLAWGFVLLVWLLANMLGALFDLIGLDFLQRLLRREWFVPILFGSALGAAVAMLRDRDNVLGMLQRVGRTILSVLAPPLAAGLVLFVLALPFTGLEPLWRETKETTPILLACMVGAFVLANAVIGHGAEEEAKARPLRWAAMALGAVMLPLAIVAAVSLGKRIGQYGFTPDRLWATVIVSVAVAVAAAYLLALLWRRLDWAAHVRRYNVALAMGVCLLALFLALPIVDFGGISARDQIALLESGKTRPDRFDWRAMRFDFGPSGRKALEGLRARGATPEIRAQATAALRETNRSEMIDPGAGVQEDRVLAAVKILPRPVPLPVGLRTRLGAVSECAELGMCRLLYEPGASAAVLVAPSRCVGEWPDSSLLRDSCEPQVTVLHDDRGHWSDRSPTPLGEEAGEEEARKREAQARADRDALGRNAVEIRPVQRRQVFVGGRPAGEPFE